MTEQTTHIDDNTWDKPKMSAYKWDGKPARQNNVLAVSRAEEITMDTDKTTAEDSAAPLGYLADYLQPIVHRPLTAPQLFARYEPQGDKTCFYCGGQCDQTHAAKDVVKSSFTGLDTVTLSDWVCVGCVDAMQEGIDLQLIDGTRKSNQKTRGYSWIITATNRQACTKSHRVQLLDACINPPSTPFVVCISDSGQKHLIYRAIVNHSRDTVTVTLEGEAITYQPQELIDRLELCKQIAAATGKPAMKESMSTQTQMRIIEHYESDNILAAWQDCFSEPLTRLAVWLCPAKEQCLNEYPAVTQPEPKPKHRAVAATPSLFD